MAPRNGLRGKYPSSFCEWVVGTTIEDAIAARERKRKCLQSRKRHVVRVEVTTDDEAEEDNLLITYPRTGQQVSLARPQSDTVIKKVRFEGVPVKSAMKKLVEVATEPEPEPELDFELQTTSSEEASESEVTSSGASGAEDSNDGSSEAESSEAESSDSEPVKSSKKQKKAEACAKCSKREKSKKQTKKGGNETVVSDSEPSEESETTDSEAEEKPKNNKKKNKQEQKASEQKSKNQSKNDKKKQKKPDDNSSDQESKKEAKAKKNKGKGDKATKTSNNKDTEAEKKEADKPAEDEAKEASPAPANGPEKAEETVAQPAIRAEQVFVSPNDPPPNAYFDPNLGIVRIYNSSGNNIYPAYAPGMQYNLPYYPVRDASGHPLSFGVPPQAYGPWPHGHNQPPLNPQVTHVGQEPYPFMSGAMPNHVVHPHGEVYVPRVEAHVGPHDPKFVHAHASTKKAENEREQRPLTRGMPVPIQYAMCYPPGMDPNYAPDMHSSYPGHHPKGEAVAEGPWAARQAS
ncbi:hypothetical protein CDD81_580 [Ophiocordyceps australis]|uniref:Uncharacterized protein n=1 Tax=Ophiocordyceps australis TaxID=1399860 RepID=A0A2C5Y991_9HYPO|nr:hypothetical protein CDD81_580 [Ophiocordyceps australis]